MSGVPCEGTQGLGSNIREGDYRGGDRGDLTLSKGQQTNLPSMKETCG